MMFPGALWKRLGAASLALAAAFAASTFWAAPAQQLAGANGNGFDLNRAGASLPPPPPQGAFGEVIMANPRWIVVQNHKGLQFPIEVGSVGSFLVRWPITVNDLTRNSMIEVVGQDGTSNNVITDHVDVFEGSNQDLVAATYERVGPNNRMFPTINPGFNRFMGADGTDPDGLQNGWQYQTPIGMAMTPGKVRVVGGVIATDPLQVTALGTNAVTVQPTGAGGVSMTEVTRGDPVYAAKGDLVFLMPTDLTTKSVVLSQLVLYKKMPRKDFRRPR